MKIKSPALSAKEQQEIVERTLHEYDREQISLGRLAEILGIDRRAATELVESRGMRLRIWPATVEEALQDARTAEELP